MSSKGLGLKGHSEYIIFHNSELKNIHVYVNEKLSFDQTINTTDMHLYAPSNMSPLNS